MAAVYFKMQFQRLHEITSTKEDHTSLKITCVRDEIRIYDICNTK
jgi:hypothetical protein